MITIIDYGLGNVRAFANIYKRLGIPFAVSAERSVLQQASKLILPGVGSFDWAMVCLEDTGIRPILDELVLERKVPILGVCVGMQVMCNRSSEGTRPGLGWIDAEVLSLSSFTIKEHLPLPHMGWNNVSPRNHRLLDGLTDPQFYFLHSYYVSPANSKHTLAEATYGAPFPCAVANDNILGVQFHPEKSHSSGVRLLANYAIL